MWSEAAKQFGEFDGVVVTAVDPVGCPVSVRQKRRATTRHPTRSRLRGHPTFPLSKGRRTCQVIFTTKSFGISNKY